VRNKIKHRQKVQDREISSGVGDFSVLHFAGVKFYISLRKTA